MGIKEKLGPSSIRRKAAGFDDDERVWKNDSQSGDTPHDAQDKHQDFKWESAALKTSLTRLS